MSLSIFSTLGIVFNISALKYLAASMYIAMIIYSLYIIIKYAKNINFKIAIPLILIIMFYPMFSIMIDVLHQFSFKALTDGLIIKGGYYQLLLVGLAISLLSNKINIYKLLYKYAIFTFPLGVFLVFLSLNQPIETAMEIGFLAITNIFIPSSLLVYYPSQKKGFIVGWMAIFIILFLSSYLGSRSYTLIGVYLVIAAIVILHKTRKILVYKMLFIAFSAYFIGAFSFFGTTSELRGASIIERYQFDSLFLAIENFYHDGDFLKLFFWEGNSRATILMDAFSDFSMMDWLFGKGINATYISFIERSTIELAWAQETFRWGILYVIFVISAFIKGRKILKNYVLVLNNQHFEILSLIILIKLLDGFVYGMPELSIYNLLVFWAVMIQSVKKSEFASKYSYREKI